MWNSGYSNGTFNLKNSGSGTFTPNIFTNINYTDNNLIGTNCTYTSGSFGCDNGVLGGPNYENIKGGSFGGNINNTIGGCNDSINAVYSNSTTNINNAHTTNTVTFDSLLSTDSNTKSNENIKETGRVEKGGKSSQEFKTVNIDFETLPFHTVEYKLKPNSEKQEGIRLYCTECGRKIKEKFNFCPTCGTKAE